jgi:hypothetical protein
MCDRAKTGTVTIEHILNRFLKSVAMPGMVTGVGALGPA